MAQLKAKHSGMPITPEVAAALADEAEEGYDLAKAERREVGRPSLATGISPRLSFRATETLYAATRQRAEVEGRTVSDLVREAVERYVYDRALRSE
jgi:hypothetical protein